MSDSSSGGSAPTGLGSSALATITPETISAAQEAQNAAEIESIGQAATPDAIADPNVSLEGFDPSINVNPQTAEEGGNLESLIDINALRDVSDLTQANLEDLQPLLEQEEARRGTATDRSEDLFSRLNAFLGQQEANLGTAGQITPEQQAAIAQRAEELIGRGSSDINTQLQQSLETLREESGASRGLRFTDTPIFDVAQDVTSSANRDIANLISSARQQQAESELNLPFQQAQLDLAQSGQFGSFLTGAQSVQDQLAQQAFNNRAQLFGSSVNTGLALADRTIGFGEQLLGEKQSAAQLAAIKAGKPSTEDKLLQAAVGIGGAALISDENVKHDITKFDEETILEKVADLEVGTWRYDEEQGLGTEKHIGPMAQEFQRVFGVGDGKTIKIVDAIGVMLATQKALAKEALDG